MTTQLTPEAKTELIVALQRNVAFQDESWNQVVVKARRWQMLEVHGVTVNDDGSLTRYSHNERQSMTSWALTELLDQIKRAAIDDMLVGVQVHNLPTRS